MEANIQIGILEYQYQRNHEAGRALKCTKVITEKTNKKIRRDLVSFIKFESEFKLRTQETSCWNRIIIVRLVLEGTSEFKKEIILQSDYKSGRSCQT